MKLNNIYQAVIRKHYPEIHRPEIEHYMQNVDGPPDQKTVNTGAGSLKWAIEAINQTDPDKVKFVMRDVIFELLARSWDFSRIETHITTFAAIKPYKKMLKERTEIDLSAIETFTAAGFLFAVNESNKNLASEIFKKMQADAIIFHNPDNNFAGVLININSKLNNLVGFKMAFIDQFKGDGKYPENITEVYNITGSVKNTNFTASQVVSFIKNYLGDYEETITPSGPLN